MVSLYFVARGEVQHCRIAAKGHRVHPASFPLRDWLYTLLKLKCSWFTMLCEFQVYSKVMCVCVCTLMCSLSHVHLLEILWAPPSSSSVEFPRQEYWSGLPFPPPGNLLNPEAEPKSLASPTFPGGFFTTGATWEALWQIFRFLSIITL